MKIALCFIINYDHILNKEHIWREWIQENEDLINVYFYYKDYNKIKSNWIKKHVIPNYYIFETSYYHVIPAYISLLNFAINADKENKWFCFLTDSCCPIIPPKHFRKLFFQYHNNSIFSWKKAWWNPYFHKRANLSKLSKELWLANDAWFVLTKENVKQILSFIKNKHTLTKIVCDGGLANESLFAIIFYFYRELNNNNKRIICNPTHIIDWINRSSTTSPHLFKAGDENEINFINNELKKNKFAMFIRKIDTQFPDNILREYIYKHDNKIFLVNTYIQYFLYFVICFLFYVLYFTIS